MTDKIKDILIQYTDLREEIKELRCRIDDKQRELEDMITENDMVSDSVKGTRKDGTYGYITITGFASGIYYKKKTALEKTKKLLSAKECELLEMFNIAEEYIGQIDDSRIRRIMRFKYIDNLTWLQVAQRMGGNHTADSCRMSHNNYFLK